MRKLVSRFLAGAVLLLAFATPAFALKDGRLMRFATAAELSAFNAADGTVAYAIDTDVHYLRQNGAWVSMATLGTLANGATWTNAVDGTTVLTEGGENEQHVVTSNLITLNSDTGATYAVGTAMGVTGDLTLSGGASALTFNSASSSVVTTDNAAAGLVLGSTGALSVLTLDTRDAAEGLAITGYETVSSTLGVTGVTTLSAGAGALTFSNTAASVLVNDNDSSALDIGSTGTTAGLRYSSVDNKEALTFSGAGAIFGSHAMGGGNVTLDESDCGKVILWTAADDGFTATLPATIAGCVYRFVYTGANGGALMDISPNASDGVYGGCTLAASVVTFSGTDDADVGITKATIKKGDGMTLVGDGVDGWVAMGALGICANN